MKYADRYNINALAGGAGVQIFNLNSTFDPDRTGVGHQPWGRDQIATLYNRYRVFAVSWRVTFFPLATAGSLFVVPLNTDQTLQAQSISNIRETPRAIVKISSTTDPTVFTGRISLASLNGQTSAQYKGADRFESLSTADPSELMTLQVGAIANSSGATTYVVDAQLTYHVEWFDPVPVTQS